MTGYASGSAQPRPAFRLWYIQYNSSHRAVFARGHESVRFLDDLQCLLLFHKGYHGRLPQCRDGHDEDDGEDMFGKEGDSFGLR
mmetsp:Transcript_35724/g.47986  ORF Transcript_35724/g.47986 Transcript_35724/m.47986 type:complete len:84 (-) Transcript_35724:597-848(-)